MADDDDNSVIDGSGPPRVGPPFLPASPEDLTDTRATVAPDTAALSDDGFVKQSMMDGNDPPPPPPLLGGEARSSSTTLLMDWMSSDAGFGAMFPRDGDLLVSHRGTTPWAWGLGETCEGARVPTTFACSVSMPSPQDGESGLGFLESAGAGGSPSDDGLGGLAPPGGSVEFLPEPEDLPLPQLGGGLMPTGWQPPMADVARQTSQRRRYDAISQTWNQSPASSEHASTGDERHVDTKPRLASGSSSDDGRARGRRRYEGDSSSDELSESPTGERRTSSSGGAESAQALEGRPVVRENSPLSDALKFLYTAAPKSINSGRSDVSGSSGSDNSLRGGYPKGAPDEERHSKTRRHHARRPIMSDSRILAQLEPSARPPHHRRGHHHHRSQARHPEPVPQQRRHQAPSRGRPLYRRRVEDMTEVECYSDVEMSASSRDSRRSGRSPLVDDSRNAPDPEWLADAKDPRCGGSELKWSEEAKEIADNLMMEAKHEAKLEAKQEAPECVHYFSAISYDDDEKNLAAALAGSLPVSSQVSTTGESVTEFVPDMDTSFFAPFVVTYRSFEPPRSIDAACAAPVRSIVRYGASFSLEEEPRRSPPPHSRSLYYAQQQQPNDLVAMVVSGDATDDGALSSQLPPATTLGGARSRVVERFQRQAPRGTVVLGGHATSRAVISQTQAAELLSAYDVHEDSSDGEPAKDELEELLAQKAARKPPRRSARPLAPAGVKLTPEERVALERERNREHARNTRLRKKAALANLKETVEKLSVRCEKNDRGEMEKRARAAVKRACIETFFRYRARSETSAEKWAQVVTEDVELWQPVTPHRSFRPDEVVDTRRRSSGVRGLAEDAASLGVLFRSIGRRAPNAKMIDRPPRFVFEATIASRDQSEDSIQEAFASSDVVGMHWSMRTLDATEFGLDREVSMNGMLVAKFDAVTCAVKHVEFVYDVKAFADQIQRALKLRVPEVIPNMDNVEDFMATYAEPCVLTTATRPHVIADVNKPWLEMLRVEDKSECVGRTLKLIQGEHTDADRVDEILDHVVNARAADAVLVNYRLTGEPFLNYLRVFPLYDNDRACAEKPSHYLGVLKDVIYSDTPPAKFELPPPLPAEPPGGRGTRTSRGAGLALSDDCGGPQPMDVALSPQPMDAAAASTRQLLARAQQHNQDRLEQPPQPATVARMVER
ncbi:hypothetical protein CTAYLR_006784 [Chrysophaeum taylorii]|uniref:BZIP domain-containing protein n=1 Tax=Chrysophaeum taylorii TaxID=2483200 RepID=A0AAD7U6P2_9STRA|nr:hypothetical protein CTAYLR_006784 [Chrysophaeum taylorii]